MKISSDTTVTLGIPAYGRVDYLVDAVHTAVNQTVPAYEIIISQNAHPDSTVDKQVQTAIEDLASSHDNIRVNRNTENCNLSTNINSIADLAHGEYVAFIGDDDRFKSNFIETVVRNLEDRPDVVFGNHDIIDKKGLIQHELSVRNSARYYRDVLPEGLLDSESSRRAAWRCSVPIFSAAIKSDVLRKHRLIDDLYGADTEFFARLAELGGVYVFLKDTLTEIRYHPGNLTKTGLQFARLVESLDQIEVHPSSADAKRSLLSQYVMTTIKKLILEGQVAHARDFIARHPGDANRVVRSRILFQRFCLSLPDSIGKAIYTSVVSFKRAASGRSKANR